MAHFARMSAGRGLINTLKRSNNQVLLSRTTRAISSTPIRSDIGKDKKHVTDKNNNLDIQSDASKKGREQAQQGQGSQAQTGTDQNNSAQKAKEEHPAAPDPAIGFQDERGGKGVS